MFWSVSQLWIITQMEHRKTENHLSVEGRGKMEMAFHAWRASFGVRGRPARSLARQVCLRRRQPGRRQLDRAATCGIVFLTLKSSWMEGEHCVCENVESCWREPKEAREPNRSLFAFSTIKLCIGNHAGVAPSGNDKKVYLFYASSARCMLPTSLSFFSSLSKLLL